MYYFINLGNCSLFPYSMIGSIPERCVGTLHDIPVGKLNSSALRVL